jgi:hypothetical protein
MLQVVFLMARRTTMATIEVESWLRTEVVISLRGKRCFRILEVFGLLGHILTVLSFPKKFRT